MSKRRLPRDTEDGFSMAFLDVMACGLGAIILIFMLVDFQSVTVDPSEELQRLSQQIDAQSAEQAELSQTLNAVTQAITQQQTLIESLSQSTELSAAEQQTFLAELAQQQAIKAQLETELAALGPIPVPDANLSLSGTGQQSFLLGLKVEGQEIGILFDTSASMLAAELIEVLRYKAQSPAQKRAAQKWQQHLRILQWIIAQAPAQSHISVVAYSDKAQRLGSVDRIFVNDTNQLQSIVQQAKQLTPSGGTDLAQALQLITQQNPNLTHLYVITDGLPTLGAFSGLRNITSCRSFLGQSQTISGNCRERLFAESLQYAPNITTNVILLPLQGDPKAAYSYWLWAKAQGGTLITAAQGWP